MAFWKKGGVRHEFQVTVKSLNGLARTDSPTVYVTWKRGKKTGTTTKIKVPARGGKLEWDETFRFCTNLMPDNKSGGFQSKHLTVVLKEDKAEGQHHVVLSKVEVDLCDFVHVADPSGAASLAPAAVERAQKVEPERAYLFKFANSEAMPPAVLALHVEVRRVIGDAASSYLDSIAEKERERRMLEEEARALGIEQRSRDEVIEEEEARRIEYDDEDSFLDDAWESDGEEERTPAHHTAAMLMGAGGDDGHVLGEEELTASVVIGGTASPTFSSPPASPARPMRTGDDMTAQLIEAKMRLAEVTEENGLIRRALKEKDHELQRLRDALDSQAEVFRAEREELAKQVAEVTHELVTVRVKRAELETRVRIRKQQQFTLAHMESIVVNEMRHMEKQLVAARVAHTQIQSQYVAVVSSMAELNKNYEHVKRLKDAAEKEVARLKEAPLVVPHAVRADALDTAPNSARRRSSRRLLTVENAGGVPLGTTPPSPSHLMTAAQQARQAERKKRAKERVRVSTFNEGYQKGIVELTSEWSRALTAWNKMKNSKKVRLCLKGIPPRVRGDVWRLAIGNRLQITPELHRLLSTRARHFRENSSRAPERFIGQERSLQLISTDLPRTFAHLQLFGEDHECHEDLRGILETFAIFRPDMGYVQGHSYVAGIFLIFLDPYWAFVCFSNVVTTRLFFTFYRMEERAMQRVFHVYNRVFATVLPKLHNHFLNLDLTPDMYLVEWTLTLFSRSLPLDVATRVFDMYLVQGEVFIFKTSLAILRLFSTDLLQCGFEECLYTLTHLPDTITEKDLFRHVRNIDLSRGMYETLMEQAGFHHLHAQ